jgi:hypothetical protein
MTTRHSPNAVNENSREDMGIESSEKSYGVADISNAPSVEKEQGITQSQNANAGGEHVVVVENKADVAPNGGYGWVCVAACATINA